MSESSFISAMPAAAPRVGALATERSAHKIAPREPANRSVAQTSARTPVERAIATAARETGVDFGFLLAQAEVESSMDPNARARTSSAAGLFQFIESTWLNTMKRHGDRFGLGSVADQIAVSPNGNSFVADPGARKAILALRNDPQIASLMAAGLAQDNRAHLTPILGRQPNDGELYLAHFLGAGGAGRFLSEMQSNPAQPAADLFRKAASANRTIFFESSGRPRSLSQVMDLMAGKIERAGGNMPNGQSPDRSPYIAPDDNVFGPISPLPTSKGAVLGTKTRSAVSLPAAISAKVPRSASPSMLSTLRDAVDASGAEQFGSAESSSQIKRAYAQLKALGL